MKSICNIWLSISLKNLCTLQFRRRLPFPFCHLNFQISNIDKYSNFFILINLMMFLTISLWVVVSSPKVHEFLKVLNTVQTCHPNYVYFDTCITTHLIIYKIASLKSITKLHFYASLTELIYIHVTVKAHQHSVFILLSTRWSKYMLVNFSRLSRDLVLSKTRDQFEWWGQKFNNKQYTC